MTRTVRFGTFVREVAHDHKAVPYEALGNSPDAGRLRLTSHEVYRIVEPYVSVRLREQARAVVPLAAYLMLFQLLILRQDLTESW